MAEVLAKQPRPPGPRLTIVTNAGGPGVLATDALIGNRGELAALSDETRQAFDRLLPPHWSHDNPVDILGDASPERYAQALTIAAADGNSDGLLVILTPQAMTDPTRTAEALKAQAKDGTKPIIASWMGGADVAAGQAILAQANIPTFPYPDTAARVFTHMWRYSDNLRALYETPSVASDPQHQRRRPRSCHRHPHDGPVRRAHLAHRDSNRSSCSRPTAFRPSTRASRRRQTRRWPPRRRSAIRSS